jgi:hypothetical protein
MAKANWQKVSAPPLTIGASKLEPPLTPPVGTRPLPRGGAPSDPSSSLVRHSSRPARFLTLTGSWEGGCFEFLPSQVGAPHVGFTCGGVDYGSTPLSFPGAHSSPVLGRVGVSTLLDCGHV